MSAASELVATLTLDALGGDRFRSVQNEPNPYGRVYGGQPMAQTLAAALHTISGDRQPTSLQQVFMSGAQTELPIDYSVTTLQEGKRVSSRQVIAVQGERAITRAFVSAQVLAEPRRAREAPPEVAAGPEQAVLPSELTPELKRRVEPSSFLDMDPHPNIEYRLVNPERALMQKEPIPVQYWVRLRHEIPPGNHLHAVAIAYMSDWWLPLVAMAPHLGDEPNGFYLASLNHTLWFHDPVHANQWFMVEAQSPWASHARGLSTSRIFTRDGTLVASAAQDCMQTSRAPSNYKIVR